MMGYLTMQTLKLFPWYLNWLTLEFINHLRKLITWKFDGLKERKGCIIRCFCQKWGHFYSFWHQYLCCNVKKWLILLSAALQVLHQFPLFNCSDIFHGIISFWEKYFPPFKHLSHCSVNIFCSISLLFLIQSRQQLKVKWFPIS